MNTEGMLSTDDKEAADVLSNKFQQAFTNHGTQTLMSLVMDYTSPNKDQLVRDLFAEYVVYRKLSWVSFHLSYNTFLVLSFKPGKVTWPRCCSSTL